MHSRFDTNNTGERLVTFKVAELVYHSDECWVPARKPTQVGIVVRHDEIGFSMPYEVKWSGAHGRTTRHWQHELVNARHHDLVWNDESWGN